VGAVEEASLWPPSPSWLAEVDHAVRTADGFASLSSPPDDYQNTSAGDAEDRHLDGGSCRHRLA
jgi:hypothetical protein